MSKESPQPCQDCHNSDERTNANREFLELLARAVARAHWQKYSEQLSEKENRANQSQN
jgi:hypothetical protein